MSRMFPFITHTCNPLAGGPCPYKCSYCWATSMKERHGWEKYKGEWRIYEKELKRFKKDDFVFAFDMVDIGCRGIPREIIHKLLDWIRGQPANFLILTKNPEFYKVYYRAIPKNCVLGATIETDQPELTYSVSKAPSPLGRISDMKDLAIMNTHRTFVSIEPIMKFTPLFGTRISQTEPSAVAVGYDNYDNGLVEPSLEKTENLIKELSSFTKVYRKTIREAKDRSAGGKEDE